MGGYSPFNKNTSKYSRPSGELGSPIYFKTKEKLDNFISKITKRRAKNKLARKQRRINQLTKK